ncbi:MAG: hypothetical protein JSU66_07685 [Deltaproteobacteria bacterium]|nr:MAG: hypothetical protein JSU66_07685 [Deltaproteobacteria bacterium]
MRGHSPRRPIPLAWAARAGRSMRRHPVITATIAGCTLAGAVLGLQFLTGDWSVARRIAAGGVAGAGTGLLITATRMLG